MSLVIYFSFVKDTFLLPTIHVTRELLPVGIDSREESNPVA